eukprot:TRINITY_DN9928_c0_g1_i1.p1 TRINITY_DN9928_c0_g1~~TRINITY_DN9928_c0_g1_i1.p1  ORF type:complete len:610 (+),score=105.71 TRINITY_DN9928_c0_g1_i1:58-1887(+)
MGGYDVYKSYIAPNICVYFPKYVRLRNERLGWLLNIMRVAIVAYIVYLVQDERPWTQVDVPMGSLTFWAESGGGDLKAQHALDMQAEPCYPASRAKYDYQFDAAGAWTYFNNSCRRPVSHGDRFVKGENEMFIPTYVSDSKDIFKISTKSSTTTCKASCASLVSCRAGSGFEEVVEVPEHVVLSSNECFCHCRSQENYFYTTVHDLHVVIDHAVSFVDHSKDLQDSFRGSKLPDNMQTSIQHVEDGRILKSFAPGEMVRLTVDELLKFADTSLREPASFTVENQLGSTGKVTYPPIWMTGLAIRIKFDFYNMDGKGMSNYDHDGPKCIITISASKAWSSKPVTKSYGSSDQLDRGELAQQLFYQYGIRIQMQSAGKFFYFDIMSVFFFLASSAVYLSLPMLVMSILIWFFLGDLTDVMDNILHETPDWNQRFALFVTKGLIATFVHDQITKDGSNLDGEIEQLAKAYHEDNHGLVSEEFAAMKQIVQGARHDSMDLDDNHIDTGEFLRAFTDGETLKDVWKMFDAKRKRPILQRLLDGNLHRRMHVVKSVERAMSSTTLRAMSSTTLDQSTGVDIQVKEDTEVKKDTEVKEVTEVKEGDDAETVIVAKL